MTTDFENVLNILVVDPSDPPLERVPIVNGFTVCVTKVKNTNEAVQVLTNSPCSLMFFNTLPSPDIVRNIATIRKVRYPEVYPIIALGDRIVCKKKEVLEAGFDDLLLSPLNVSHIENKVRGWAPFLRKNDNDFAPYILDTILEIIRAEHMSKGFFNLLLDELTHSSTEITDKLRQAYGTGQANKALELLHKLRSTFGSVGAMHIVEETKQMESIAQESGNLDRKNLENLVRSISKTLSDFRELQILFP